MSVKMDLISEAMMFALSINKAAFNSFIEEERKCREALKSNNSKVPEVQKNRGYILETIFTDKELLIKALKKANICYKQIGNRIECLIKKTKFIFEKGDRYYLLKVNGELDLNILEDEYKHITNCYGKSAKEHIIQNIKRKIKSSDNMKIIDEQVQEDKSVVITIEV